MIQQKIALPATAMMGGYDGRIILRGEVHLTMNDQESIIFFLLAS